LSESALRLWASAPVEVRKLADAPETSLLTREKLLRTSHWDRFFESPPRPVILANTGAVRLIYCKGVYMLVRGDLSLASRELSPLVLRKQGSLAPWIVEFADRIEGFGSALFWPSRKGNLLEAKWRYAKFRFQQNVKAALRPYKRLYRAASWIYRIAAGMRRRLASTY